MISLCLQKKMNVEQEWFLLDGTLLASSWLGSLLVPYCCRKRNIFDLWWRYNYIIFHALAVLTAFDCLLVVDRNWQCGNNDVQLRGHHSRMTTKPLVGGNLLPFGLGWACMTNKGLCYCYPVCSAIPYTYADFSCAQAPWS